MYFILHISYYNCGCLDRLSYLRKILCENIRVGHMLDCFLFLNKDRKISECKKKFTKCKINYSRVCFGKTKHLFMC